MQYGGFRLNNINDKLPEEIEQPTGLGYRHYIHFGPGLLDIPKGYEDNMRYNGTLAHKTNHSFENNVRTSNVSEFINIILNMDHVQS